MQPTRMHPLITGNLRKCSKNRYFRTLGILVSTHESRGDGLKIRVSVVRFRPWPYPHSSESSTLFPKCVNCSTWLRVSGSLAGTDTLAARTEGTITFNYKVPVAPLSYGVYSETMDSIRIVSFGTSTIQKLRRVALDPNLLTTLGLSEGDTVKIELDVDNATIMIRKDAAPSSARKIDTRRRARA